jgi:tetratricopeptide (TPR) repeat protein
LKDQPGKAIDVYLKIVEALEGTPEIDHELAIYNKVGDLYLKTNEVNGAVEMYERAAHRYIESGLPNNAIALCNKILRNAPGRTPTYLMLGDLMLKRGFGSEAKQHFIEYAQRMSKGGKVVEAFKALKKSTDASPPNQEVRAVLVEQLEAALKEHPDDTGLAKLYQDFTGRASTEAVPEVDEKGEDGEARASDLVFIDLDEGGRNTGESAVEADSGEVETTAVAEPSAEAPGAEGPGVGEAELAIERPFDDDTPDIPAVETDRPSIDPDELDVPVLEGLTSESAVVQMDNLEPESPVAELEADDVVFVNDDKTDAADSRSAELPELDVPELDLAGFDVPGEKVAELEVESTPSETSEAPKREDANENLEEYLRGTGAYVLDGLPDAADQTVERFEAFPETEEVTDVPELPAEPEPKTVESLEAAVAASPDDPGIRRELAELLLEHGERNRGLDELDVALQGYENAEDWDAATSIANEIIRLEPNSVVHLQKCVEFVYRRGDESQLVPAYLALANGLFRSGSMEQAQTVYERVVELDPENQEAKEGLATVEQFVPQEEPAAPEPMEEPTPAATSTPAEPPRAAARSSFVDLGDLILGEDEEKSTRMVGKDEQGGHEQRDLSLMLSQFKKGIEENIDEADAQAHYDLGVAFKEMGLLDEAISEFQKALRSDDTRLRAAESLGLCFYEKGQLQVAATVMRRAVDADKGGDEAKIGLLYWLGRCEEEQSKTAEALVYYQRAFAVDIKFQDVGERVSTLSKAGH